MGDAGPLDGTIRSYRDLHAWQVAIEVVRRVYRVTAGFPADERFGLTQQLRRASVGIASNIAEGFGRGPSQDFHRFLRIARGSLFEAETQLYIARDLDYLSSEECDTIQGLLTRCAQVLAGLLRSVESRQASRG